MCLTILENLNTQKCQFVDEILIGANTIKISYCFAPRFRNIARIALKVSAIDVESHVIQDITMSAFQSSPSEIQNFMKLLDRFANIIINIGPISILVSNKWFPLRMQQRTWTVWTDYLSCKTSFFIGINVADCSHFCYIAHIDLQIAKSGSPECLLIVSTHFGCNPIGRSRDMAIRVKGWFLRMKFHSFRMIRLQKGLWIHLQMAGLRFGIRFRFFDWSSVSFTWRFMGGRSAMKSYYTIY